MPLQKHLTNPKLLLDFNHRDIELIDNLHHRNSEFNRKDIL